MRLRPCGEHGLLVELDDVGAVVGLHRSLRADPPAGLLESVPAARTVLLLFDPQRTDRARLGADVTGRRIGAAPDSGPAGPAVEIPVVYDGPDLDEVAERTGLPVADVIHRHAAAAYTVAFCGFAPGFGYLTGLDPALRVPRRSSPRTRVPAGAVAIADHFSGVYPRSAPGGWHLLGRTDAPLWSLDRDPPALLRPGVRVRFVVREPPAPLT